MTEPIISLSETRIGYCANCAEPKRIGALSIKGWIHTPVICAGCLRTMATTIELDGASPLAASVAENRHE